MVSPIVRSVLVSAALLVTATGTRADTLSDNLAKLSFSSEFATDADWLAASFGTDDTSWELSSVVLRMALLSGSPADVVVEIRTSVGAAPGTPGALVGTLTTPASVPATKSNVAFTSSGILLAPSSTYWVVLRGAAAGTLLSWSWTPDDSGSGVGFQHTWGFSTDSGGAWSTFDTAPLQMQVNADEIDPWTDLGFGLPGGAGIPQLTGAGPLLAGSPGQLALAATPPAAPALLFASTSSAPTPFKGGLLVPVPVLLVLPVAPVGVIASWTTWPAGLSGVPLVLQCALVDAGAVKGVALSNALGVLVP